MKYINITIGTLIIFIMFSCNGNKQKEKEDSVKRPIINIITVPHSVWIFDKVVGQTIYFKFNKKFTTNLYNLKYIGQLQTKNKAPFLIFSGRGCDECDENISIYIHSPSDGPMKDEFEQPRFDYPGKEFDYENNRLVSESRMFYGNCVNSNSSVIWLQKTLIEKGKFQTTIFSVETVDGKLKETSKLIDSLSLKDYIPKCNELPGESFSTEP